MQHTQQELDKIWNDLKAGKYKPAAELANQVAPGVPHSAPKIMVDDHVEQALSMPIKDGHDEITYTRKPGGQWKVMG